MRESYDVDFIYVVLPLRAEGEDNLMDVIAGTSEHERLYESDELTYLGHYTEDFYPPDIAQCYLDKRAYKLIQESLPATDAQSSAAPADPGSEA